MEYTTTEAIFICRDDLIVEMHANDNFKDQPTIEGALENIAIMQKLFTPSTPYKGLIVHLNNQYTKKEIIKSYHEANLPITATALISNSYVTNFVVNIVLKIEERFQKKSTTNKTSPSKSFTTNDDATQWLYEIFSEIED